ncbi:hypothetical protein B0A55_06744 [Friedmanniomyces simplex]|uniref:Transglycosylase SLT domain-containing protein n=1 Tax=Friedmanniomyces simplex TaxID=329884 RepID=A0A4U0X1Z3_9PEZI|nr:hypothetical protein B0A55_06744 [Friedmanniomyces simplex]
MAAKPGRYYSGQYSALVGNSAAFYSNNELDQYDDHARKAYGVPTPPVDDHPLNQYGSQDHQPLTYDNLTSLKGPLPQRPRKAGWSRRRKCVVFGGAALLLVIVIAVVVGVVVAVTHKSAPFNLMLSNAQVTNDTAFTLGGATHSSPNNTADGIGAGADAYTYYQGVASNFPQPSAWVSFENMWNNNLQIFQTSCKTNKHGPNNSNQMIQEIYDAIQNRSTVSLVDHRFILAIILQESQGCPRASATTSVSGVTNPGLMQSHNGTSYSPAHSADSILAMVQDGTQGTSAGDGLVQNLDMYGSPYSAARGYNSGYIPRSGDLSDAAGATACYVSDVANRLTGWVYAASKCPGKT